MQVPHKLVAVSVALLINTVSTNLYAQANCNVQSPNTDVNNDGYADQYVSPNATVRNSNIDCSFHDISSRSVIDNSNLSESVAVEWQARVVSSSVSQGATVKSNAVIIDSLANGFGTVIGKDSLVRNNSAVVQGSVIGTDAVLNNANVIGSDIGYRTTVRDSRVTESTLGNYVQLVSGANVDSIGGGVGSVLIRQGTVIRGGTVYGPIDIGQYSFIKDRAEITGSKFIGPNFRIGEDSTIAVGGDILSNVTIGSRVTVDAEPIIGNNVIIGSDANIGFGINAGSSSVINNSVSVGGNVTLEPHAIVARNAIIGSGVILGIDAIVGANASIGNGAILGERAVVKPGASVPAGFNIAADTVYPNDY